MSGLVIGAVLLTLISVFVVLDPLVSGRSAPVHGGEDEPTEAESRKRVALLALRDVEYDWATGKLTDEDYRSLKSELAAEALHAIREEEGRETTLQVGEGERGEAPEVNVDDPVEREIARYREKLRSDIPCSACGHRNPAGSRFCSDCGTELEATIAAGR